LFCFRGFKGKRSHPDSEVGHQDSFSAAASPASKQPPQSLMNSFSNDGSFLEQFKKLKKEPKIEAPKLFIPTAAVKDNLVVADEKPPEADDWYKSALEKARQIAQNMTQQTPPGKKEFKQENKSALVFKTDFEPILQIQRYFSNVFF
jgi:hypothetical protein